MEAQLGGGSALEDEAELELLAQISEKELCEESAGTLGGTFAPILVSIAEKAMATGGGEGGPSETLLTSALLALSKLCACSASLSSVHLQLLFTLLGGYPSPPIRCLLVVALGDLAFRFPNLVEPYQHLLYARLRDCDSGVRKQALMILSHLILNGMVKVKGQVGELAICLNDPDPRISGITKMVCILCLFEKPSMSPPTNLTSHTLPFSFSLNSLSVETTLFTTSSLIHSRVSPGSHRGHPQGLRPRESRSPQKPNRPCHHLFPAPRSLPWTLLTSEILFVFCSPLSIRLLNLSLSLINLSTV